MFHHSFTYRMVNSQWSLRCPIEGHGSFVSCSRKPAVSHNSRRRGHDLGEEFTSPFGEITIPGNIS